MQRTTIMLPPDLVSRAKKQAKSEGISLGELIRRSMSDRLKKKTAADPLFDLPVFEGGTPEDLAENHDKYLYGEAR